MANHRTANVIFVDTTNSDFPDVRNICAVKYVGSSSGTATIKSIDDRQAMWEAQGTDDVFDEVKLRSTSGIEVEVTNGATVYVYLK